MWIFETSKMPGPTQFKHAIGIFSVISSPSRLEILRQLNAKGPMSYSELKTNTGFRAKKESGKFAYHLRKLLKQGLITHNKLDRKYGVTPLGRLVLSSAREIDEKALLQIGQLTIRTSSRETVEPFHVNKIMQTLSKEANVPRELAQKIATETEYTIYNIEDLYITTPKVRELVNCMLIREGKEEYRERLAKLGVSVWDLEEVIYREGANGPSKDLARILYELGRRTMREYLLFAALNRDIVDAHLNGSINISDSSTAILAPDYVTVPPDILKKIADIRGGEIVDVVLELAANTRYELALYGFNTLFDGVETFCKAIDKIQAAVSMLPNPVLVSLVLSDREVAEYLLERLNAASYSRIAVALALEEGATDLLMDYTRKGLASSISYSRQARTYWGLPMSSDMAKIYVSGISINMPRIAYEAQGDEVYFKAKTLQIAEKAQEALRSRMKLLMRRVEDIKMLVLLAGVIGRGLRELITGMMNIVGYREAIQMIGSPAIEAEVVRLTNSLASEEWEGEAGILYDQQAGARFHKLDRERIIPAELPHLENWSLNGYSSGYYVGGSMDYGQAVEPPTDNMTVLVQAHELIDDDKIVHSLVKKDGGIPITVLPTLKICKRCGSILDRGVTSCPKCGNSHLEDLYFYLLNPPT